MSGYGVFAEFYDRLTTDVAYGPWADYLLSLFERHGRERPETLLDLACGSGSLSLELAAGAWMSSGWTARRKCCLWPWPKAARENLELMFLEQDMRELDLFGTVSGAVCLLDSLNHITNTAGLAEVFRRLGLFIEPGGLLVFDANTPYKHREILGDNAFVLEEEDFLCVWRNRFIGRTCEVEMTLDFFVEEGGLYERLTRRGQGTRLFALHLGEAVERSRFRAAGRVRGAHCGAAGGDVSALGAGSGQPHVLLRGIKVFVTNRKRIVYTMSRVIRCLTTDATVMAMAIDATDMVAEAERIHHPSAVVTAALGRLLTASSLMGIMLKGKEDSVTLKLSGNGPAGTLMGRGRQPREYARLCR